MNGMPDFNFEPYSRKIWHLETGLGIYVIDTEKQSVPFEEESVALACCVDEKTIAFVAKDGPFDEHLIRTAIIWYLKEQGVENPEIQIYKRPD